MFFLTGTDEHGQKIEEAAKKKGLSPKAFVDSEVVHWKEALKVLGIEYDRFIRTTDEDHERVASEVIQRAFDNGDIYKGHYEGLYCVACEKYYTEKDLVGGVCPDHKKAPTLLREETYFFKLSKYQNVLLEYYEKHPDFIEPEARCNEVVSFVKSGLEDISCSRVSFTWGIPLPFDRKHFEYVWFDALTNYLTGVGYLADIAKFKEFWPECIHLVGKDILRFHAVIWPAILLSAGLPLPKKVYAHGWWTIEGQKISKTIGNVVRIPELTKHGVDAARYFLLREIPFGGDGDFSRKAFVDRYNADLANDLGNLVLRVSTLALKNAGGKIERVELASEKCLSFKQATEKAVKKTQELIEALQFDKALDEAWSIIRAANRHVNETEPWKLAKTDEKHFREVIYCLSEGIRAFLLLGEPFIPTTVEKIRLQFGFERVALGGWRFGEGKSVEAKQGGALFPKIEEF